MNKYILLGDGHIPYILKKSARARRARLSVYRDGRVVVTVPWGATEALAERFVREKAQWIIRKVEYFKLHQGMNTPKSGKQDYLKHKGEALLLVKSRVEYFNKEYGFAYNKVNVKDQKTRWGSCSKKGNLNFSYRILFLAPEVRDLVIVHELCHLKEFNHSEKFWNLVAITVPDHKAIRKELRKSGLHIG